MSGGRWERVEELFHEILASPDGERSEVLRTYPDAEIVAEVESLLAAHQEALRIASPLVGQRLGAWRITREIGRGGMGAIYEAVRDDDQFRKRVAIKVIKRGMDSEAIVRRFRNERQILADLDHPNIARLLDGGTTPDGLPFFVMEYIDGRPLDRYCAEESLDVEARVRLFLEVCRSVDHAHRRGVVHRDLKPSNILVTSDGIPKLLDFGIAKVMITDDPAATATAAEHRPLTPAYASPEQLHGRSATAAADVYSLGVILYELLTGGRPHTPAGSSIAEIAEAVATTEPRAPSATARPELRPVLRGHLDAIVLTALSRQPDRRYRSAGELADDLARYVSGQAPVAQRRRRARLTKSALFATVVVVLPVVLWMGVGRLPAGARDGGRKLADSEAFRAYLSARHHWEKRTPESLRRAQQEFERAIDLDPSYARAWVGLSETYALLGEYRVLPANDAMPRSRAAARRALEIDETLAEAHAALAYVLAFYDWDWERAGGEFRRALALDPNYGTAHQWYGEYLTAIGRFAEARSHFRRAEELDPLSRMIAVDRAGLEYIARDYDEAIAISRTMIERDPRFGYGYVFLWIALEMKGLQREAVEALLECEALFGIPRELLDAERAAFEERGHRAFWMLRMQLVTEGPLKDVATNFDRALHASRLHDPDETMRWLLESEKSRDRWLVNAAFDPQFDLVRHDPRFAAMLKRMGLRG